MKRNTYKNLTSLIIVLAFCLTLLLPIIFSNNIFAMAENVEENTEIVTEEIQDAPAVLDNNVKEVRDLYNYDGSADYVYVELAEGGYAVFAKGSNELLEYSPHGSVLEDFSGQVIYGGPGNYYSNSNNVYTNILSNDTLVMEKQEVNKASNSTRQLFKIDSRLVNNNTYSSEIFTDNTVDDEISIYSVPPIDEFNPISPSAGAKYIEHEEYFLADPTYGENNGESCTTVAAQLMVSYNNYYNDRRLIPDEYLNGTKTTNPNYNPNYCTDPMYVSRRTLGSNQAFHDYLYNKDITGFPKYAKNKLNDYLKEQNLVENLDYTLKCEDTLPNVIDSNKILAELYADRPTVISTVYYLNGTPANEDEAFNHSVLAYGYQYLAPYSNGTTYLGYITHFGWSSYYNQVWANSAWFYTYMSLNITHTHNYYSVGAIGSTGRTEYKCRECGHRTDVKPDKVYLDISKVVKNNGKWDVTISNISDTEVTALYNGKMCFDTDAKNWKGLTDVSKITIPSRSSKVVTISGHLAANSIAVSYVKDGVRLITYANELTDSGGKRVRNSYISVPKHEHNGMTVRNVGKNVGKWLIELTNKSGRERTFEYNGKLCFEGDAKNWQGHSNPKSIYLASGQSTTLEIEENGTATSVAISYKVGLDRYIFYAYDLNAEGRMTSFGNVIRAKYYEANGIKVAIDKKIDNTWHLSVINNTGKQRKFEYNSKMCFAGDAENWKGLNDVKETLLLQHGDSQPITITENYSATSIAISYMDDDGINRKVFYAYDLKQAERTMTANGSTVDTTKTEECIAAGTLITLADGSQKAVEQLTGDEMLLVWNLKTGTLDSAPIMFIDSDPTHTYDIINLHFSDETVIKVIYEHGFWDFDLNSYVYLDENAEQYIGHWFNKQTRDENGNFAWEKVQLTQVTFTQEYTTAYSPVTYGHLCYFVNGMLSMPGGIEGLFNIFEVDKQTMTYDLQAMAADIEEYGLFTYEEFYEIYSISEEVFEAFNGEYLKVAIGKGLITYERIAELIERYSEFF